MNKIAFAVPVVAALAGGALLLQHNKSTAVAAKDVFQQLPNERADLTGFEVVRKDQLPMGNGTSSTFTARNGYMAGFKICGPETGTVTTITIEAKGRDGWIPIAQVVNPDACHTFKSDKFWDFPIRAKQTAYAAGKSVSVEWLQKK